MSTMNLSVRSTDPDTSYEAAIRDALGASKVRPVIVEILREHDEPMTRDEIIAAYRFRMVTVPGTPKASDSGIRTRLKELLRTGVVCRADGRGKSTYGNSAALWELCEPDVVIAAADPDLADDEAADEEDES